MKFQTVLRGLMFPESLRWHDDAIFFSDQYDGCVWRLSPDGQARRVLEMPGRPSGLGWLPDGTMLVVSMLDRRLLRAGAGGVETFADLRDLARGPTNDMIVDSRGRAYVGNFGYDYYAGEQQRAAALVRVDPDGAAQVAAEGLLFPNGSAVTPDGATLIVAESFASLLTAFDIATDGSLSNRRVYAEMKGINPDGICLDAQGAVWVACAGSRKAIRVLPGGAVTAEVFVEDGDCYACVLGGAERRDLYLCVAPDYRPEAASKAMAGRIDVCRVEVPGAGLP